MRLCRDSLETNKKYFSHKNTNNKSKSNNEYININKYNYIYNFETLNKINIKLN